MIWTAASRISEREISGSIIPSSYIPLIIPSTSSRPAARESGGCGRG